MTEPGVRRTHKNTTVTDILLIKKNGFPHSHRKKEILIRGKITNHNDFAILFTL